VHPVEFRLEPAAERARSTPASDLARSAKTARTYDDPVEAYTQARTISPFRLYGCPGREPGRCRLDAGRRQCPLQDGQLCRGREGVRACGHERRTQAQGPSAIQSSNTAYRQGKLEDAIKFYQAALEVNPNDEDAKFTSSSSGMKFDGATKKRRNAPSNNTESATTERATTAESATTERAATGREATGSTAESTTGATTSDSATQGPEPEQKPAQAGADDKEKAPETGSAAEQQATPLTPEEAQRYLDSLSDDKPLQKNLVKAGGRRQVDKDW